jgi:hypothetical protein
MTMIDDLENPIPKPKRKPRKRKKARSFLKKGHVSADPVVIEKVPPEFAGITRLNCPTACNINGCVIALGRPVCTHPLKSGIPNNLLGDLSVQESYDRACIALGVRNIHKVKTEETTS